MTFQQIADTVLAEKNAKPVLPSTCFAISSPEEIKSIIGPKSAEDALPTSCTECPQVLEPNFVNVERNSDSLIPHPGCGFRSMKTSLASYRHLLGTTKTIYDLGQSAEAGRARTDLKHGELPTLATTTSHLWCPDLNIFMLIG